MPSTVSGPNASSDGRSLERELRGCEQAYDSRKSFYLCERAGLKRLIEDVSLKYIRDFKMPRRRRQRERQKSNRLNKQNLR